MNETANVCSARRLLDWRWRSAAMFLAMCLFAMLGTAASLKPASAGLGTHQQLGLPPCSFRVLFDMRCPACGMTTSWSHFVRGQWIASLQANPGGTLLAMLALSSACYLLQVSYSGRAMAPWSVNAIAIGLIAALVVAGTDWVWRTF